MKNRFVRQAVATLVATSLLAGCSSVKLNINAPGGVVIKERKTTAGAGSELVALGTTPIQLRAKCATGAVAVPGTIIAIATIGLGLIPVIAVTSSYSSYDYVLAVDQKTLLRLGFSKAEAAEAMSAGGEISLRGHIYGSGCNKNLDPHAVEIGVDELKAVLLLGGVGSYEWKGPSGETWSTARYSVLKRSDVVNAQ